MAFRLGLFLVLIVALIAVSIFGVTVLNKSNHKQMTVAPVTEQILVANTLLQAGSLLQPGDLASGAVTVNATPAGATIDSPAARSGLIGSMIRMPISPGAPILTSAIIHPGDHGFLAAVLAPGMRAVTIGVDAVSGAAGLIWPGDHVDVLLTQTLDDPTVPLGQRIAAEAVLVNVRVIATGQQIVQGSVTSADPSKAPPEATTVTLEVTPDQAERCEVATHLGPLSLVVHSAEISPVPQNLPQNASGMPAPVWADEVSPALSNIHPNPGVVSTVHVFSGSAGDEDFKF
jgi:pilus assembly protein CpaB